MRCLIPITQEMRNENALRRAPTFCDEIHILYVVDRGMLDRMERESAYVLNSETLKNLENAVIDSQKEKGESILKDVKKSGKKVNLHFEVGEYFDVLEKYVLRRRPHILMTDIFDRRLLSLKVPVWIDAGNEIKKCVFVVESVAKIKRLRKDFEFLQVICRDIRCNIRIFCKSNEKDAIETLKRFAEITTSTESDLLCLQFFDRKHIKKNVTNIILYEHLI